MGALISSPSGMPSTAVPVVKDIVLVGGGHSHVIVLRSFAMQPMPGVRLTLITKDIHTPYSGMIPGYIAGHYSHDDCHIDLRPLSELGRARLIHASAVGFDLKEQHVVLEEDRPPIRYDILSVDIGITPLQLVPGAAELTVPVKPISTFTRRWEQLLQRIKDQPHDSERDGLQIVVVGGGAGGVELILAMHHTLHQHFSNSRFCLVTGGALMPTHNGRARHRAMCALSEKGVSVVNERVVEVQQRPDAARQRPGSAQLGPEQKGGILVLEEGGQMSFDNCVWCTQGGAAPWLRHTGLELDANGFILVNDCLQSVSHPNVFAAGDIHASFSNPRPKAGVFAVRQGMPLANNLRRAVLQQPLVPFRPQRHFLSLISTGGKDAIATRGNWAFRASFLWTLKDYIDRSFMTRFSSFPDMDKPGAGMPQAHRPASGVPPAVAASGPEALALISNTMRCAGCGSKVGSTVLSRVLTRLATVCSTKAYSACRRSEALSGLGAMDDGAVLAFSGADKGSVQVQTMDFFPSFISDPFVFGRVAANHALGDCFAMGAAPVCALALAVVPLATENKMEEDLFQMLAGAQCAFKEANCEVVGGHTSEGKELSLGFTVTGTAEKEKLLRKGGLKRGDCLILTKPIGTGTILAANMRLKAKGRWVEAALKSMLQSSQAASEVLKKHRCAAATDVTGFGLLGHLVEMVKASNGVSVCLDLDSLPLLDGAAECTGLGIFSSLYPSNSRLRRAVSNYNTFAHMDRTKLLFDPQTAGGLLAAVPAPTALACLSELHQTGYHETKIIGQVQDLRLDNFLVCLNSASQSKEHKKLN